MCENERVRQQNMSEKCKDVGVCAPCAMVQKFYRKSNEFWMKRSKKIFLNIISEVNECKKDNND